MKRAMLLAFFWASACEVTAPVGVWPDGGPVPGTNVTPPVSTTCNAQTCPGGCCKDGMCIQASAQSLSACGTNGQACSPCQGTNAICDNGLCYQSTCGPCRGCCSGRFCIGGVDDGQCGSMGEACQFCAINEKCRNQKCEACGPQNCSGCCDTAGNCLNGDSDFDCGKNGASCDFCGNGSCVNYVCRN